MKIIIAFGFLIILTSLGFALFSLMKDKSKSNRTVKALTVRIFVSIALFLTILFAYYMGWIHSTGIR